jgi:hypothetical protein
VVSARTERCGGARTGDSARHGGCEVAFVLSLVGLGFIVVVGAILLRRGARTETGPRTPSSRRFVVSNSAALDTLCAHARMLSEVAQDACATRVSIDVLAVSLLDESSLALLSVARANLARRGIALELAGCTEIVADQLRRKGLGGIISPALTDRCREGRVSPSRT